MVTVEEVQKIQAHLFLRARALVESKGHDYSGHDDKDTFFNLRLVERIGLIPTGEGILVRLCDKISRLISFSKQKDFRHESLEDTVVDIINYATYFYIVQTENNVKTYKPYISDSSFAPQITLLNELNEYAGVSPAETKPGDGKS